ncbi:hypothetical protein B0H10DRAFT_1994358 [Mycena sp. CBHHK59/15]|nr:hypothetical protein B0H10DRAFT_1994358 [Mycena sp. CBHHK59/15]
MTSLVRTTTHTYPAAEVRAINGFYSGRMHVKRCALSHSELQNVVQFAHQTRLEWMLHRKLRQVRNEPHAAELRENLLPLNASLHCMVDAPIPDATLFPREDVLIRTLAYERDVQAYRLERLRSFCGDPGRPEYADGYPIITEAQSDPPVLNSNHFGPIIPHRFHCTSQEYILRVNQQGPSFSPTLYSADACPGIPLGPSGLQFPVVDTLLSIPFSILHNLPRLQALQPYSPYQAQLVAIATEIILLWGWDSSPTEVAAFPKSGDVPVPLQWPVPILHPSRVDTVSATVSFTLSFSAITNDPLSMAPTSSSAPTNAVTLQSGEILLHSTDVHWDRESGLVLVAAPIVSEKGIDVFGIPDSPSLAWDDYDADSEEEDQVQADTPDRVTTLNAEDVILWVQGVQNCGVETLPELLPTPFCKGTQGGMAANDILMNMGAIDPTDYAHFLDLASFRWESRTVVDSYGH